LALQPPPLLSSGGGTGHGPKASPPPFLSSSGGGTGHGPSANPPPLSSSGGGTGHGPRARSLCGTVATTALAESAPNSNSVAQAIEIPTRFRISSNTSSRLSLTSRPADTGPALVLKRNHLQGNPGVLPSDSRKFPIGSVQGKTLTPSGVLPCARPLADHLSGLRGAPRPAVGSESRPTARRGPRFARACGKPRLGHDSGGRRPVAILSGS